MISLPNGYTVTEGINDDGQMLGTASTNYVVWSSPTLVVVYQGGRPTPLSITYADDQQGIYYVAGINGNSQIAGNYLDTAGSVHG